MLLSITTANCLSEKSGNKRVGVIANPLCLRCFCVARPPVHFTALDYVIDATLRLHTFSMARTFLTGRARIQRKRSPTCPSLSCSQLHGDGVC